MEAGVGVTSGLNFTSGKKGGTLPSALCLHVSASSVLRKESPGLGQRDDARGCLPTSLLYVLPSRKSKHVVPWIIFVSRILIRYDTWSLPLLSWSAPLPFSAVGLCQSSRLFPFHLSALDLLSKCIDFKIRQLGCKPLGVLLSESYSP